MTLLHTSRLSLREFTTADAAFMLAMLNSPGFLRHIGDRGVRTVEQAERYLADGPIASYAQHGFGMYLVQRRADGVALGLCGLVRRAGLDDVDIGFAFLPQHCGLGYGRESAQAVLWHARQVLGLARIVAIVARDNAASVRLLESLGLRYEREVTLPHSDESLLLYGSG